VSGVTIFLNRLWQSNMQELEVLMIRATGLSANQILDVVIFLARPPAIWVLAVMIVANSRPVSQLVPLATQVPEGFTCHVPRAISPRPHRAWRV
jgi:hypothetical protein